MKKEFFFFLLFSILISCNNRDSKDKAGAKKTVPASQEQLVVGIGEIIPKQDIIQVSTPVDGLVKKIYKNENDSVSAGTPIIELDHEVDDAKVRQLSSEVNTQVAQINADEASVGEYKAKYDNAVSEVQRLQRLLAKGAETQQAVDNANTTLKTYQANLKRLEANVEVAKSQLQDKKAALQLAKVERDQKTIVAPVSGRILELNVLPGGAVNTQQPFAKINPEGKTIAVCEIDELYADKIAVGQKGWIRNVGSTDTLSTGTVYFASSFLKKKSLFTDEPGEKQDRRVRTIKMTLDHPTGLLLNARIECVIDVTGTQKK